MRMDNHAPETKDSDAGKGAVEDDQPSTTPGQPHLQGQMDHRSSNAEVKNSDTDFPEPGSSPEHSGQHR